ncbi:MAG: hypothetical protein JNK82_06395 [Myxococcaceae bacterium]|nr:hypothetical protein [Myxococcaceae bacterium]
MALLVASSAFANALDHLRTTDDIGLNKNPHLGQSRLLVIPSRVGRDLTPAELQRLQAAYDPAGPAGSFRAYWRTTSVGRYDPVPTVVQPVIYRDRCPLPGKTMADCRFTLTDLGLITQGGLRVAFEDIIRRVRDEQGIDLTQFDVNGADAGVADGYFDGVILDTDMYSGIAVPLAALVNNTVVIGAWPQPLDAGVDDAGTADAGPTLRCGIVGLIPPDEHEYGHTLGFIDLYNGPRVNDLMADVRATLGPFSRQQIGWGDVLHVDGGLELDLKPVLEGGPVLRIGDGPKYLMLENRGGPKHATYEGAAPGIWVYSVDETKLPTAPLGFLDIVNQRLYYPNEAAPYLYVNVPLNCQLGSPTTPGTCALTTYDEARVLADSAGQEVGFTLRRSRTVDGGTIRIALRAGTELPPSFTPPVVPPPVIVPAVPMPWETVPSGCGCQSAGAGVGLVVLALLLRRRRG